MLNIGAPWELKEVYTSWTTRIGAASQQAMAGRGNVNFYWET